MCKNKDIGIIIIVVGVIIACCVYHSMPFELLWVRDVVRFAIISVALIIGAIAFFNKD